METSSESESYDRTRGHRSWAHDAQHRPGRNSSRTSGSGFDAFSASVNEKMSTLTNALEHTSKNMTKVERMIGQQRAQDQTEAMILLQAQRLNTSSQARSPAASSLHNSDLEACSGSDGQRFYPTSPLRDYVGAPGRRRRSQSASVHFKDSTLTGEDIHTLHQSLRDLRCDQQRLSDDLDREILRRNKFDIDTRRAMESLTEHLTASQRPDPVSCGCLFLLLSRVERRLHNLEQDVRSEPRSTGRESRLDQRAAMSDELQEVSLIHHIQDQEREEAFTARLQKSERDKSKLELERTRRQLEQSEASRESLLHQVEDMHGELLRTRKEKTDFQMSWQETSQPSAQTHAIYADREDGRGGQRGPDLEKEVAELRAQLCKASVLSEVEELKKALDRQEKEKSRLSLQVEELLSELARREQQHLRLCEQLKEIQSREQAEKREAEALLQESTRSREELKTRAQTAVRQWRAKCMRQQKELEEAKSHAQFHSEKAVQATREQESARAQLKVLSQQAEAARRELAEILSRLAQREEELHRKDVELNKTRQRHLTLERQLQEVKDASAALEEETRCHAILQERLKEENQRLEEKAEAQRLRCQKDKDVQSELQAALKDMTSAHAQLVQRLSEEENSRNEFQKNVSELRTKLTAVQEESASLRQQLQLEREVHQQELSNMNVTMEDSIARKERQLQDVLKLRSQERDEMQAHLREVEDTAASDKELCGVLSVKLDRMKDECNKLTLQLKTKEEAHARLHRKYQLLKQDDKTRLSERELVKLEEKVLQMESEQAALLSSVDEELDSACRSLDRNSEHKLQTASQNPGLVKDPRCWLAETKTKLRWLCEEVRERELKERRFQKQNQQTRDQLKAIQQSWDSEQTALLQRLHQQEKQMHSFYTENKELLEKIHRKEEDMRHLQDRVLDIEKNTRIALEHMDSLPERKCLMDNFKDLQESQRQRDVVHERYSKYKEIVWDLQHQLDESKRKIQECREEKLDATSRSLRLAALSSSIKEPSTMISGSDLLSASETC
ncbi:centrosomal protein of 128 kDa-like [Thalassophryne amazonica]|uniref:centrosomal protein of 128 kDa-like n=1 Tax=Thalassophryne amazonica TaxID=390379 RepID=UPI0014723E3A|nr:centrosomal protein of 128 kDa-like [Thalassophryne amazonica]